jgi:hypothetical protein
MPRDGEALTEIVELRELGLSVTSIPAAGSNSTLSQPLLDAVEADLIADQGHDHQGWRSIHRF